MLSLFVLFSSWLSFSCNVFGIVCDLHSLIHILTACVRFTASFFFWIEGAALLFLPSELSDTALLHGTAVIASNYFLCRYLFISSAFFLLRVWSGHQFNFHSFLLFSVFVSFFQSNIVFCFLTISSFLNFQPGLLLFLLDIVSIVVSNSFRSFVSQWWFSALFCKKVTSLLHLWPGSIQTCNMYESDMLWKETIKICYKYLILLYFIDYEHKSCAWVIIIFALEKL